MDQIVTVSVVLLPTLFAVVIEMVSKEIKDRPKWRICVLLFGLGLSALTWTQISRADKAHKAELVQQHTDIENLRGDLHKSETERQVTEAYLKAKLEDSYQMNAQLAQLGPALMTLAKTSADFERKQYETKVTSNKELYDFTLGAVKKIRDFSQKYSALERQQTDELMAAARQAQSDTERQQRWNAETQKEIQLYYAKDAEFRNSILPDALYSRNELLKRKIAEPSLGPMQKTEVDIVLRGSLAGVYPELALANYLELMARQIPLK